MLMYENEMLDRSNFECMNVTELEPSLSPVEYMEINCVFCGIMFHSAEEVETHIAEEHEDNNASTDNNQNRDGNKDKVEIKKEACYPTPVQVRPYFPMSLVTPEKLTVYDEDLKVVNFEKIKLDQVKLCMKCSRHFLDEQALSYHQFKEHAIRKRKRSSHPNCVEGIKVTLEGTWGCDICTREFATLKQAKVHKFKSHIEPAQKQEILSGEFARRCMSEYPTPTQQYRQILPIDYPAPKLPLPTLNFSAIENIATTTKKCPSPNNVSDSHANSGAVDLSQSPVPKTINTPTSESVWTVKLSDNQDTKISFSKVVQETSISKEIHNPKSNAFFAYNASTNQYTCSHCPAIFSSRAVYSRHILVHRRGKAFVCEGCAMAFTRNHTLKQHRDSKCVIANPIVGVNCQFVDQCPKCRLYFASSNSHLSHCRKMCKVLFGNSVEESVKGSVKSEDTNAQCDGALEIDLEDNSSRVFISDFVNNPAFVTKATNEFNCNMCSCYFPSYKSIGHHLEHYHRIVPKKQDLEQDKEGVSMTTMKPDTETQSITTPVAIKREDNWWSRTDNPFSSYNQVSISPTPKLQTPTNFALVPMMTMSNNNEVLNLSTNSVPSFIRHQMMTQFQYKPRNSRKMKTQPNANGEFECTECHKAFGCRSSLSNHIKSHFNLRNKPFSCTKCGQGFMSHVSYEEHINSQCTNVHGISTSVHTMPSPGVNTYNYSGSSPSPSRSTCCMHCNATFTDRSLLEDHAAREHSNEHGEVKCINCSRSFSTYMAFRVHMTKSHGGPNGTPLKNSINMSTPLPFLMPYSSLSQIPISSPVLRYKCTNCNQDFINSQTFDNHKATCPSPAISNNESPVSNNQFVSQ